MTPVRERGAGSLAAPVSFWPGSKGKLRCTHAIQPFTSSTATRGTELKQKPQRAWKTRRSVAYLGAFCYLPALQTKLGTVCVVGLPTIVWSQVDRAHRVGAGSPHHRTCAGPFSGSPPRLCHALNMRAGVRAVRWSLKVNNQRGLELISIFSRRPSAPSAGADAI